MWNKIKKIGVYILIAVIAVFLFIVCRRYFIGRGLSGITDIIGHLRDGNSSIGEGLGQSQELAGQAGEHIESAHGHAVTAKQAIRRAREILLRAKDK